jgi:hypothetical protein
MSVTKFRQRRGAEASFALAAILAALLFLASAEAFALAGLAEFDAADGRRGAQLVRQAVLGGLLLVGPLKAELLLRD